MPDDDTGCFAAVKEKNWSDDRTNLVTLPEILKLRQSKTSDTGFYIFPLYHLCTMHMKIKESVLGS